jgi:adenylate kinase
MTPKTYLFFGNVGAGKGTQIEILKKLLEEKDGRVVYAYPGNEFRALSASQSFTSQKVKESMEQGNLQPVFLVGTMVTNVLMRDVRDDTDHIIFDGFPRSIKQVEVFEEMISFYKREHIEIVYITISKEEATRRMKLRGRSDDTDVGIAKRFDEYEKNVSPALFLLKERGYKIYEINGEATVEEVSRSIVTGLGLR